MPAPSVLRPPTAPLPLGLSAGLTLLLQAHDYAQRLRRDPWEFALELRHLSSAGLSPNHLRWLLCAGYVEHAVERTPADAKRRSFRPLGSLTLPEGTCFVLTADGLGLARLLTAADAPTPSGGASADLIGQEPVPVGHPRWDKDLRELWSGELLIKAFRRPAPNQERVLASFEEERWPGKIDDPLPGSPGVDAQQRLHDTINRLNRGQRNRLVIFRGDGSGAGVRWEWVAGAPPGATPDPHQVGS